MARKPFIAGNWKLNKTVTEAKALAEGIKGALEGLTGAEVALCPTYVCLSGLAEVLKNSHIKVGAQNVYWETSGAFTGEISTAMLKDCGCDLSIVGHSERRQLFGETDETVNKRLKALLAEGLDAIVCVGESLGERESGSAQSVVQKQVTGSLAGLSATEMESVTVAYEPVWAIGTGRTATPEQAQEMHAFIRGLLKESFGEGTASTVRIQYGGSVKPGNAEELMGQPDIDGALVGGASLKVDDFVAIVKASV